MRLVGYCVIAQEWCHGRVHIVGFDLQPHCMVDIKCTILLGSNVRKVTSEKKNKNKNIPGLEMPRL